jgi:tetratricopeptide (TPR) repeat protein
MRIVLASLIVATCASSASAATVFVKGKDKALEKVDIKSEDAKNVVITHREVAKGKKKQDETILSVDIDDIIYDIDSPNALALKTGAYQIALAAEKDSETTDSEKRKKSLQAAIFNFNETFNTMTKDKIAQKNAARHLQFKIAVLGLRQGTDKVTIDLGIKRLKEFAKDHHDSWQINQALPKIAQLQMDIKDFKEATNTFQEMADMEVFSTEVRRKAKVMVVTVAVRSGNIDLANKKLDELDKEAGGNPAFAASVKMARAEVLIGLKKMDKALEILHDVIKTSTDKESLAIAHNTIGESLFKAEKYGEARWEFLFVDTIYNQDKHQHAKALYYLWKTFEHLNDLDRAQQCLKALSTERFAGTEFQKLANAQAK